MASPYRVPGLYRQEVFVRPPAALPTGVPGFIGLGREAAGPVALHRVEDLPEGFVAPGRYLADAVAGFFANGGTFCYAACGSADGDAEGALTDALRSLAALEDLDLVAVPDAMGLPEDAAQRVQAELLRHCAEQGNRFAILDCPGGKDPNDAATRAAEALAAWRRQIASDDERASNGALYYPWIRVPSADVPGGKLVPPCGHVAGVFARSDASVGVFKAPANEELVGVLDLEFPIDAAAQETLNAGGINCLRALRGRGLRVWGARTLSADPSWLYVSVRRLFLTLARWIDRNMRWAAFEANTPRLWIRIQRELSIYLARLWQAGALKGASAAEAFYVKCDAETNPADAREQGRVTTEVGLAPAFPAEFVVVRIVHRPGAAQFN